MVMLSILFDVTQEGPSITDPTNKFIENLKLANLLYDDTATLQDYQSASLNINDVRNKLFLISL